MYPGDFVVLELVYQGCASYGSYDCGEDRGY
ncbi:hypothetical protein CBM2634_B100173 [Cupriavidus taiwanensis]|uniref:Uncharacterized protein n=1 Tax=Cupriavidus taiwanensis TaxID=164546 RepID=A0A375J6J0_9BURK|nr:hypothetical protein CBM2634_B100173 [Cupriavidus taiwanensis]